MGVSGISSAAANPVAYYFAYGSNLLVRRLKARVGEARLVGLGRLREWRLHFNFMVGGGHVFCDILNTQDPNDEVWGAVFAVPLDRMKDLDKCEGCPSIYHRQAIDVEINGQIMNVIAYIGTNGERWVRPEMLPYDWYVHHVVLGAFQLGLPQYYQEFLKMQEHRQDPNINRFLWEARFWQ